MNANIIIFGRVLAASMLPLFSLLFASIHGVAEFGEFSKQFVKIQLIVSCITIPFCMSLLKGKLSRGLIFILFFGTIAGSVYFIIYTSVILLIYFFSSIVLIVKVYLLRKHNDFFWSYIIESIMKYFVMSCLLYYVSTTSQIFSLLTIMNLVCIFFAFIILHKRNQFGLSLINRKFSEDVGTYIFYLFSQNFVLILLSIAAIYISNTDFGQLRLLQTYVLGSTILLSLPIQKALANLSKNSDKLTFPYRSIEQALHGNLLKKVRLIVITLACCCNIAFLLLSNKSLQESVYYLPLLTSVVVTSYSARHAIYAKFWTNNEIQFKSTLIAVITFVILIHCANMLHMGSNSLIVLFGSVIILERALCVVFSHRGMSS